MTGTKAVNLDDLTQLFAPIVKVEKSETMADDGLPDYVVAKGICSGPDVDIDDQRMDSEWLRKELPAWFSEWGNIRAMHKPDAVGIAKELTEQEDGDWYLAAKIVDRDAVRKTVEGVYKGFSIGIKSPVLAPDALARKGRYVGGKVIEVSLVDRPAYGAAKFNAIEQPAVVAKFVLGREVGPGEWKDTQTGVTLSKAAEGSAASAMPQVRKNEGGNPVELSFEQIRDKVNQAVRPADTEKGPWVYVMDTYPTYVIISEAEKYYQVPYTIGDDGTVALGQRGEVVRTYSPVAKVAALELAKKAVKAADGEEEESETDDPEDKKSEEEEEEDGKEADSTCEHCGRDMEDGKCKGCDKSADECTCERVEEKGARASKGKAAGDMGAASDQGIGSRTSMNYTGVGHDILQSIKDLVAGFVAQVDGALRQINDAARQTPASIPATGHASTFDPNNPAVKASLTEIVKAILVNELVTKADPEFAGKVIGTDSAKAVLADVVKGLVTEAVGNIDQRLQVVEQAAAPAKGGTIEVERSFAGIRQAGASPEVLKAAETMVRTQTDQSEAAQLARASAMLTLSQTLTRPAQS